MADLVHLEKMSRELKCPICWSLFESAVSLVCNHIFCNTCIMESMKSVSGCPVCKVPFHRREIHAAPHMDNLVSIYKSMEVTAGDNICSTQVGTPTQTTGIQQENSNTTVTRGNCQKKSNRKRSSQMKRSKEIANTEHSPRQLPPKPSFPAKKRIHVTPYPIAETPLRPQKTSKLEVPVIELTDHSKLVTNVNVVPGSVEDLLLSPFFWLKGDDDNDQSPQKSSGEHIIETPSPQSVPSFSDIRDSADDNPTSTTPTNKLEAAVDFDSEMFEWTQRACSPELCPTPQRTQSIGRDKLLSIPEEKCQKVPNAVVAACDAVPLQDDKVEVLGSKEKNCSKKRKSKVKTLLAGRKSSFKRNQCGADGEVAVTSGEMLGIKSSRISGRSTRACKEYFLHNQNSCAMNLKSQNNNAAVEASGHSPNASAKANDLKVVRANIIIEESNRKTATTQSNQKRKKTKRSKNVHVRLLEAMGDSANEEEQDQISHATFPDVPQSSHQQVQHKKWSRGSLDKRPKGIKKQLEDLNDQRARNQGSDLTRYERGEGSTASLGCQENEDKQTSLETFKDSKLNLPDKTTSNNREENYKPQCEKRLSPMQCVFCHSCDDTEYSGEMMHYFNGKPVAADFKGGINVVHSHKHCTEWAPDVYFDGDIAINLTTEVSRSKRMKCSCCGVKGAALGCYEKSCRKSFHFTCAKLMPECKWDTENFVMLCPIHSAVKLPNELSEPQRQSRKRSTPKGGSQSSQTTNPCGRQSQMWTWPSGSPCKWVLCCSALSAEEKEVVAKFSKVTCVPVLNSWNPEVTHVIASTDRNGAYRRTLKILKGILDGKWILSIGWIKACMEAMEPVGEKNFEVTVDIYGINDGPRLGRLRIINKQPKLFSGLKFYFSGDYTASYKGYLQDLVIEAGGAVLQRKPITRDHERLLCDTSIDRIFIIFGVEQPEKHNPNIDAINNHKRFEAHDLAIASGATLAASTWIIDSIAACKLQSPS